MSTPIHIIVGTTIASILTPSSATPLEAQRLVWFSILTANLPDLDMIYMGPKRKNHRLFSIFHFPLFWMAVSPIMILGMYFFHIPREYMLSFIFGLISHFILDMCDPSGAISLFAPFSNRQYSWIQNIFQATTIKEFVYKYFQHSLQYEAVCLGICLGILGILRS